MQMFPSFANCTNLGISCNTNYLNGTNFYSLNFLLSYLYTYNVLPVTTINKLNSIIFNINIYFSDRLIHGL